NVPLVPGAALPPALETLHVPLVVGLFASPERIVQIRQNRLLGLNVQRDDDQYIDRQAVAVEVAFSRRLCARNNWPLIDVTRRSIEETAAAVMALLADRRRAPATCGLSDTTMSLCHAQKALVLTSRTAPPRGMLHAGGIPGVDAPI